MVNINSVPVMEESELPNSWTYQDSNEVIHIYRDHSDPEYAEVIIAENGDVFDVVLEYTDAHVLVKEDSASSAKEANKTAVNLMENAKKHIQEFSSN